MKDSKKNSRRKEKSLPGRGAPGRGSVAQSVFNQMNALCALSRKRHQPPLVMTPLVERIIKP